MTFLAPLLLLGLLLVPVLIGLYLWAQRRRSRYAVRFTNLDLLANIAPKRPSWRRHLPPVLYLTAVAFLVLGLARPSMVVAVPREDATVMLAIDVSGSMKATDVAPTRLDAAKDAARSFVAQLPEGIRVGVVSFASRPQTLVQPTDDRDDVIQAIDRLEPLDGTAMGDALMQVLDIAEDIQAADAAAATPDPTPAASDAPAASDDPAASPGIADDQPDEEPLVAAILLSDGAN
jgi:Ca-activated chloride channel family protein